MDDKYEHLEPRDRERFWAYEELFECRGWQLLCEEFLDPEIEDLPRRVFEEAKDWDEVLAGRAALAKLLELRTIPAIIDQHREHAEHEHAWRQANPTAGSHA